MMKSLLSSVVGIWIFFFLALSPFRAFSQVNGYTSCITGYQYTYSYAATQHVDEGWFSFSNGNQISQWQDGQTFYSTVEWQFVGPATVTFFSGGMQLSAMAVTIVAPPVAPSTTFSIQYQCGSTIITRNSTPPSGYTWYWQTEANGTRSDLGSSASVTITSPTALYIRAVAAGVVPQTWSPNSQYAGNISVFNTPTTGGTIGRDGNGNVCAGSSPGTITNITSATGAGAITYQWEANTGTFGQWEPASWPNSDTYMPGPVSNTTSYRRKATALCGSDYSNTITATVYSPLNPGTINGEKTACYSQTGNILGNVTNASGSNGVYSYQWQKSTNGTTWSDISGANGLSYTTDSLKVKTYFQRLAITQCKTLPSNVQVIDVRPSLYAGSIGQIQQVLCQGTPANELLNTGNASGGDNNYIYQWQKSADRVLWENISGEQGTALNPGTPSASAYYRRNATSCLQTKSTFPVYIKVDPYSNAGTLSESAGFFTSASGTLSVSGVTGSIQKWQSKTGSGNWGDINNTSNSLPYTVNQTTYYKVFVKNGNCPEVPSNEVTITIHAPPVINSNSNRIVMGKATLDAGDGYSGYTWRNQNAQVIGSARTFVATTPGAYTVTVAKNGVSGTGTSAPFNLLSQMQDVNMNYIITNTLQIKITDANTLDGLTNRQLIQDIVYYDGLGRPIQEVSTQASPSEKDEVLHREYDDLGRESKKYLPYASTEATGIFKANAVQNIQPFYNDPQSKVAVDSSPFTETIFELSPLNRVIKQGATGSSWQPDADHSYQSQDHTIKKAYQTNISNEVLLWTFNNATQGYPLGIVNASDEAVPLYYTAGELYKNKTKDEHQNELTEYVDKEGRIILKKVQVDANAYAQTYYIYDDFGNLVCVLPPQAVKLITLPASEFFGKTNNEKNTFLERWAFRYQYDTRKRMTQKQVPGAAPVYMIYDKRDRLVLSQDGNQRDERNEWTFTKYDVLNRPVLTGIVDMGTKTLENLRTEVQNATVFFETAGSAVHGYTNVSYPVVTDENNYLTATYYDNYDWHSAWGIGYQYSDENLLLTVNNVTYQQPEHEFTSVRGQVTGTKTKVLDGTHTWLKTVNYYDDKYRLVQVVADNYRGGTDRTTSLYDFTNKVLRTRTNHNDYQVNRRFEYDHAGRLVKAYHQVDNGTEVVLAQNEYNELGQVVTKKLHRVGQSPEYVTADPAIGQPGVVYASEINSSEYRSTENTYIASKRIRLKKGFKVQSNTFKGRIGYSQQDADAYNSQLDAGTHYKQLVDYRYNIRGWLTRINNSDLSIAEDGVRDYFGMDLFYNEDVAELGNQEAFNGNISAIQWSTNLGLGVKIPAMNVDEPKALAYTFSYDTLNRLKSASHHIRTSVWNPSASFYEGNLKYDLNGNIRNLNRADATGAPMDQLSYVYTGNQLQKVSDIPSGSTKGFIDGADLDHEYTYDANGNMNIDRNKGIDTITYNYLNLPDTVRKNSGEYVRYTYDATGRKLRQVVYDAGDEPQKKSDYVGEFFYENDTLKFINHEEGRIVMTGPVPEYQYHLKDHLGNVRLTFTTKGETDDNKATLETANIPSEQGKFLNYDEAVKINTPLFDHTNQGATNYSTRLLGGNTNEIYGLAKSFGVMPGDTINIEVFAKYIDRNESSGWTTALQNLMAAIAAGTAPPGTLVDVGAPGSIGTGIPPPSLLNKVSEGGTVPKAYLNYIVFDRNFNPILSESGFKRITTAAKENGTDIAHERLFKENLAIREPGYMYIYLSNENDTPVEVFFDDFKIEHIKSPVVQMDDYYPFGLTYNSHGRENDTKQNDLYNGKEIQDELSLGWYDYGARMYMSDIGRWGVVDPHSEKYYSVSPYNYAFNSPTLIVDPNGKDGIIYLQVMVDENGKSAIDKKVINKAVAEINNRFKEAGIDLRVEAHYSNEVIGKKEFYSREGAHKSDSYLILGSNEQISKAANEASNKGWDYRVNSGDFEGINGQHSRYDNYGVLNADNLKQVGIGADRKMEDYKGTADEIAFQKLTQIGMHEDGHSKLKEHPNADSNGHTPGTIMAENPKANSVHDLWMIRKLKTIHGVTPSQKK